jgi:D-beta-D-heptose 7-phosphate kinase/D-beta-D-heptose 1-phosphate adenosyltransferase
MRVDRERNDPLPRDIEARLCEFVASTVQNFEGIILSDYAKGVCTPELVAAAIRRARQVGIPVVVDPGRRTSFSRFAGCDVITPNRHEAEIATGIKIRTVADAADAGTQLCAETQSHACAVTLDADGAMLATHVGETRHFPADVRQVVDSTGAGDAFAATLLQSIVSGRTLEESTRLANYVASLQVERFGTAAITRDDLTTRVHAISPTDTTDKCVSLSELDRHVENHRQRGETIVLTNGCFDLLHAGHVNYLEKAASEGACLIVAINSDRTVSRLKGSQRPVVRQQERARLIAGLACVDYVVVFEEQTPHVLIRRLRPDVLVKGGDYALDDVVGRELVEAYGGSVKTLGLTPGLSTSRMLERITAVPVPISHAG